jgi:hypothetical protein
MSVTHVEGNVAPVDKTVTYGTVIGVPGEPTKCWITSNLGADHQATSLTDATEASAGWYWQFNRMQGFKHTGSERTPNTTWITSIYEDSEWLGENDPCSLLLGNGWRIPTSTEWTNVDASGGWTDWNGPWNSILKLHAAGSLSPFDGSLDSRGSRGYYWSKTHDDYQNSYFLMFRLFFCSMNSGMKEMGNTIRCLRE